MWIIAKFYLTRVNSVEATKYVLHAARYEQLQLRFQLKHSSVQIHVLRNSNYYLNMNHSIYNDYYYYYDDDYYDYYYYYFIVWEFMIMTCIRTMCAEYIYIRGDDKYFWINYIVMDFLYSLYVYSYTAIFTIIFFIRCSSSSSSLVIRLALPLVWLSSSPRLYHQHITSPAIIIYYRVRLFILHTLDISC